MTSKASRLGIENIQEFIAKKPTDFASDSRLSRTGEAQPGVDTHFGVP